MDENGTEGKKNERKHGGKTPRKPFFLISSYRSPRGIGRANHEAGSRSDSIVEVLGILSRLLV